jgi:dihydrofolate reductase
MSSARRTFSIVVAFDLNNAIGSRGKLPWQDKPLTRDMQHFRELTRAAPAGKRNAVIMGTPRRDKRAD